MKMNPYTCDLRARLILFYNYADVIKRSIIGSVKKSEENFEIFGQLFEVKS